MIVEERSIRSGLLKFTSYIILGILFVATIYPLFWTLMTSLKEYRLILKDPAALPSLSALTLHNYGIIWREGVSTFFFNSIFITVCTVIGTLFLSAMAGYGFARFKFRGSDALFLLFAMSLVVVAPSIMISEYLLLHFLHLLSTRIGIILLYWSGTAFGIIMTSNAFRGVPQDIIDAAHIDGCGEFTVFLRIAFPLIKPTLATITIFTLVWSWNTLIWPLLILQKLGQQTIIVALLGFLKGQYMVDWGCLTAGLSIGFLPMLVGYFFFQKYFVQGLTLGSMKG